MRNCSRGYVNNPIEPYTWEHLLSLNLSAYNAVVIDVCAFRGSLSNIIPISWPAHTIKMFIPHIPVVSSSLTPPGSLYPRSRQGKVAELRTELNSGGKRDKNHSAKKIALKKIVANMTMSNNDMVALFPDIVNCMQIPSLEVKKM